MIDLFRTIKEIKNEIKALKTTAPMTATKMATTTYSKSFTANISVGAPGGVYSDKIYIITIDGAGVNMITSIYQGGSNFNKRYLDFYRFYSDSSKVIYRVKARSLNTSDINTVMGGGSVSVNFNVLITTTAQASIAITKKNASWWGEI